jgi:hypothetical protein
MGRFATTAVVAAAVALSAIAAAPAAAQSPGLPPIPIPGTTLSPITPFEGAPATPRPIDGVTPPPQHPFMAPNERSNIHNDAYMTDVNRGAGPLGRGTTTASNFFLRECGSIAFDSKGRIVTVCVGLDRPVLTLMEPVTLKVLAIYPLPLRDLSGLGGGLFTDFSGGGYFYLDQEGRAVLPTTERHILVAEVVGPDSAPAFQIVRDFDVRAQTQGAGGIVSVLPDWGGRLWFVTRQGVVGTIDPSSGHIGTMALGEGISNSFSVDSEGGVYIVSDKAMYRFDTGPDGGPKVTWRAEYSNSGIHKPGQSDAGSGTTPTLMGSEFVAITDNADPMNVVVYRRANQLPASAGREVCRQAVFRPGAGNTDQSLIGTDTSLVAENNYGYASPLAMELGGVTEPGLARVDVVPLPAPAARHAKPKKKKAKGKVKKKKKSKGKHKQRKKKRKRKKAKKKPRPAPAPALRNYECKLVWTSPERAPSVVPKLSLATGLVYTYTKPKRADNADAWFFTALDFRTGETIFKRYSGAGLGYNNNYAPVTLGPDGTAYVGTLGGLTRFTDAP